jgi:hypothetical protein
MDAGPVRLDSSVDTEENAFRGGLERGRPPRAGAAITCRGETGSAEVETTPREAAAAAGACSPARARAGTGKFVGGYPIDGLIMVLPFSLLEYTAFVRLLACGTAHTPLTLFPG